MMLTIMQSNAATTQAMKPIRFLMIRLAIFSPYLFGNPICAAANMLFWRTWLCLRPTFGFHRILASKMNETCRLVPLLTITISADKKLPEKYREKEAHEAKCLLNKAACNSWMPLFAFASVSLAYIYSYDPDRQNTAKKIRIPKFSGVIAHNFMECPMKNFFPLHYMQTNEVGDQSSHYFVA